MRPRPKKPRTANTIKTMMTIKSQVGTVFDPFARDGVPTLRRADPYLQLVWLTLRVVEVCPSRATFGPLVGHGRTADVPQTRMRPVGIEPTTFGSGGQRSIP